MSLEKSIQKLTQVISAATRPTLQPGVGPGGVEVPYRDPCKNAIPGDGAYCMCYKKKNKDYSGPCYFQSSNGKCYVLIYQQGSSIPVRETLNGDCPILGVPPQTSSL
jgi:hypothetical protein